jgi:ABC-type lipoprotein export system ATPase subunit
MNADDQGIGTGRDVISCRNLVKTFSDGEATIVAVDRFSASFVTGEMVAVTGPSGSGKTTLLNLISAVDYPDSGEIESNGFRLSQLSTTEQADYRARHVSIVHSDHNLLPMMTIYENISLSLSLCALSEFESDRRIRDSLESVGIAELAHRLPGAISSGERARAALARAAAMSTPAIVADEPTAHLDHKAALEIATLLRAIAEDGRCVIVATHDATVSGKAHRRIRLRDGKAVK